MLIALNIFFCLLNLALAFTNYKKKDYKIAMVSIFLVGFFIPIIIALIVLYDYR